MRKQLKLGSSVCVPSPEPNDLWEHEFTGTVKDIKPHGIITVVDQDDDCWDVEADRLTIL